MWRRVHRMIMIAWAASPLLKPFDSLCLAADTELKSALPGFTARWTRKEACLKWT